MLKSLKPYSSSDKISAHMLKHTASWMALLFITCSISPYVWIESYIHQWKHSVIVPIPKSTRMADPGSYRPTSLICILYKLLEKHVCSLTYDHLFTSHQLSDSQWGISSWLISKFCLLFMNGLLLLNVAREYMLSPLITARLLTVSFISLY